jgi:hypothetical protein
MAKTLTTIAALLALAAPSVAQPLPHPKVGQCSGGYVQSGGFCIPKTERSQPAVPKVGQCPASWRSGALTCERMDRPRP